VLEAKPDVYGSLFRFDGQVSVFHLAGSACYRCLFPSPPPSESVPTCAEGGVLGVLAGMVGTFQANEALKVILGIGEPLAGRLLLVEALSGSTREVYFKRDPACAVCGDVPSISDVQQTAPEEPESIGVPEIDPDALEQAMSSATLLDVREPHEVVLGIVAGSVHVPASQLEARMHELDSARTYIVACRLGQQSRWAVRRLRDAGFRRLLHLRGGLLGYAVYDASLAIF
jgi:rhodanese-related sulfurtransferase